MAKISTRGQVTIPRHIRQQLGFDAAAEVEFAVGDNAVHIRVNKPRARLTREEIHARIQSVRGSATDKSMTTDEMMRMLRGDEWPSR